MSCNKVLHATPNTYYKTRLIYINPLNCALALDYGIGSCKRQNI